MAQTQIPPEVKVLVMFDDEKWNFRACSGEPCAEVHFEW